MAVHAGSGVRQGLIEILRANMLECKHLELVHRLDRGTSGCLIIAKKRGTLKALHDLLVQRKMKKCYVALVKGKWKPPKSGVIDAPLLRGENNQGDRIVRVHQKHGKEATTSVKLLEQYWQAA
jgi:23S rRNA pseudouridine955/2504/2580 synthase